MPTISDFNELDLTGLNVDHVRPTRAILRADYGDGYADTSRVGALGGVRTFQVSGLWPDDASIASIAGKSWKKYYSDFFDERLDNANEPFIISHEGRKWLVDIEGGGYGYEVHTSDLFTPDGITLNLRRVRGLTFCSDGSLFDPSLILSSTWGRWRNAASFPDALPFPYVKAWSNEIDPNNHSLEAGSTDVVVASNVLGSHDALRFSGTTNNGFIYDQNATGGSEPTIYEAYFVMKMREATFSNFGGILSADVTIPAILGNQGTTKFFDIGLTANQYEYRKNAVAYAINDQQAPMNAFGVVHARFLDGVVLENLQIGKDRDFAGRFAEMDLIEAVLCSELLDDRDSEAFSRFLMTYYGIS